MPARWARSSYARALRDRLPAVAKVFATGVIDFRMVLTIIARTENVDDDVMPGLDAAIGPPRREVDEAVPPQVA